MNEKRFVFLWMASILISGIALTTCGEKNKPSKTASSRIQSVCMVDGISLRGEPSKSGKWLSSINLGETVYWKGDVRVDSTDNNAQYVNVLLSDSTEGWSLEYGIITNARVGAIMEDTPICKRPDPLTTSDNRFKFMDIVAVSAEKDNWMEVIGEKRAKKGWIQYNVVTTLKDDVTSAVLASKKMKANDGLSETEKIKAIIESAPYPNSFFIEKLRMKIGADAAGEPSNSGSSSDTTG